MNIVCLLNRDFTVFLAKVEPHRLDCWLTGRLSGEHCIYIYISSTQKN